MVKDICSADGAGEDEEDVCLALAVERMGHLIA